MKLIATNIEWEDNYSELPESIKIPEYITDEDEISDYISNQTGHCHKDFVITGI